jgi:hypothetical protein
MLGEFAVLDGADGLDDVVELELPLDPEHAARNPQRTNTATLPK